MVTSQSHTVDLSPVLPATPRGLLFIINVGEFLICNPGEWIDCWLHLGDHIIHCLKQDALESKKGQQMPSSWDHRCKPDTRPLELNYRSSLMPQASETQAGLFV